MSLRLLFTALAACLVAGSALAAQKPYRVSLTGDGFDGKAWHTGVLVELDPGWKTYWRMPGEAGIPPEFTWTTSAPADVHVDFPVPARHTDKSGDAIGYQTEVLFPVTVTPKGAGTVDLGLDMFFAVCKDVCIPAQAKATISLGPEERDPLGSVRAEAARGTVPAPGTAISAAALSSQGGKPVLQLSLTETPDDIFVETDGAAYFHKPDFSADGRTAVLGIDNLSDPAKLKGQNLRLTYSLGGKGHEQTLALP